MFSLSGMCLGGLSFVLSGVQSDCNGITTSTSAVSPSDFILLALFIQTRGVGKVSLAGIDLTCFNCRYLNSPKGGDILSPQK